MKISLALLAMVAGNSLEDVQAKSAPHQIKKIIVLMMENRSFDNMLGWMKRDVNPQIEGLTGEEYNLKDPHDPQSERVYVHDNQPYRSGSPGHSISSINEQVFGTPGIGSPTLPPGAEAPMNGFASDYVRKQPNRPTEEVMGAYALGDVPISAFLAEEFAVFDRWFCSVPGNTQPNRAYLHTATSEGMAYNDVPQMVAGMKAKTMYESLADNGYSWTNAFQEVPSTLVWSYTRPWNQSPDSLYNCLLANEDQCIGDGEGGLGMCLVQNDCIQMDDDGSLNIPALTGCVQRIPIVNPNPACGDKLDAVAALACVASCDDLEGRIPDAIGNIDRQDTMPCILECVKDNVDLAPPLSCALNGGVCSENREFTSIFNNTAMHYSTFKERAAAGNLPDYTYLDPRYFDFPGAPQNDNHPGNADVSNGEILLKETYEIIRNSPHWEESLFVITYDEHGGFYDHVSTPLYAPNPDGQVHPDFAFDRLGVRVPTIMVSPWIKKGTVVHGAPKDQLPTDTSEYEASSVYATVKKMWNLDSDFLTKRDEWASTFEHIFDELEAPRTDCPLAAPDAPAVHLAQDMDAEVEDLQRNWIDLISGLVGENVQSRGMTEGDASLYIKRSICKMAGKCVYGGADYFEGCDDYDRK